MPTNQIKSDLCYFDGKHLTQNQFRIGASGMSDFFSKRAAWFRTSVLGQDKYIESPDAMTLGTIVHYGLECYARQIPINDKQITLYIEIESAKLAKHDMVLNLPYIKANYPIMIQAAINGYLMHNPIHLIEEFMTLSVLGAIVAGGSVDGISVQYPSKIIYLQTGKPIDREAYLAASKAGATNLSLDGSKAGKTIVLDYKTSSQLSLPKAFTTGYKRQLLIYAKKLIEMKFNVTTLRLLYITTNQVGRFGKPNKDGISKPLKDSPSEAGYVDLEVTPELLDWIDNQIKSVAHSVQMFINGTGPMRAAIAGDYNLIDDTTDLSHFLPEVEDDI